MAAMDQRTGREKPPPRGGLLPTRPANLVLAALITAAVTGQIEIPTED